MNAQENDEALLDAYSETVSQVAARVSPAVVKLEAEKGGRGSAGPRTSPSRRARRGRSGEF